MPSEELYEIVEQPAPTCPKVDKVVASLRKALERINGWQHADEADLREACDYAEFYISQAEGGLEEVREHAAAIRGWGQKWKDLAKKHAPPLRTST